MIIFANFSGFPDFSVAASLMEQASILAINPGHFMLGATGITAFAAIAFVLSGLSIFDKLFGGGGGKVVPKTKVESLREQKRLVGKLKTAAFQLDVRGVRKVLEQGVDINARGENIENALLEAFSSSPAETPAKMVAFLVENGADLDAKYEGGGSKKGMTPLILAAKRGDLASAKILIDHGADVNARRSEGWQTALMLTGGYRDDYKAIVNALLDKGADIDTRDSGGRTALIQTCYTSSSIPLENAAFLLERGADIDAQDIQGMTALMVATDRRNDAIVEMLLEHGADVALRDSEGYTALWTAKKKDGGEIVISLLEEAAKKAGHDEKEMLSKKKKFIWLDDMDDAGNKRRMARAFFEAVEDSKLEDLEDLLEQGADINAMQRGKTALMIAATDNSDKLVTALLEGGAKVDIQDKEGKTALILAAYYGHGDIAKLLLEKGADFSLKDKEGRTAMDIAREEYEEDVMEVLEEAGAS